MWKICLPFGSCDLAYVGVPLTPTGTPLAGMGIGGTQLFTASVHTPGTTTAPPPVGYTVQHSPWTIGQAVMTIHTAASNVTTPVLPGGFAHGPASLTSSTAEPSGVLQLVTVSKVFTTFTGAFPEMPVTSILTLHFVPEPGTLLLLVSGVLPLAVLGWLRQTR
jgi:hypothetical protein